MKLHPFSLEVVNASREVLDDYPIINKDDFLREEDIYLITTNRNYVLSLVFNNHYKKIRVGDIYYHNDSFLIFGFTKNPFIENYYDGIGFYKLIETQEKSQRILHFDNKSFYSRDLDNVLYFPTTKYIGNIYINPIQTILFDNFNIILNHKTILDKDALFERYTKLSIRFDLQHRDDYSFIKQYIEYRPFLSNDKMYALLKLLDDTNNFFTVDLNRTVNVFTDSHMYLLENFSKIDNTHVFLTAVNEPLSFGSLYSLSKHIRKKNINKKDKVLKEFYLDKYKKTPIILDEYFLLWKNNNSFFYINPDNNELLSIKDYQIVLTESMYDIIYNDENENYQNAFIKII